jgi:hypothetical protein
VTDRLPPPVAARLRRRLVELAPLGSLAAEHAAVGPDGERALAELAARLCATYPYSEPAYAGQMLKPPHPIAWAAYAATMLLNPNNHSLDGGPATSELEREAVAAIAAMVGLDEPLGHLTSSGTVANLEALWIAKELHPDRAVVSGENAHYTHPRLCEVIGARHETIPEDERGGSTSARSSDVSPPEASGRSWPPPGRRRSGARRRRSRRRPVRGHGARLHVDAAYGGFFALLADGGGLGRPGPFRAIARADSVVVDPTSTACSPTAAAACCSRIPASPASTCTTLPTRTSAPRITIRARPRSNARGRERRRRRSGRLSARCR